MMKKVFVLIAAVVLTAFFAMAETPAAEPVLMEGVVLEVLDDGYRVYSEQQGEFVALVSEDTLVESGSEIACGDYVYIDTDGTSTRSLPPQMNALVVRMFKTEGEVTESDPEANTVVLDSYEYGEIVVNLPEAYAGETVENGHMTVYFNGAMTMSLPAQIGAGLVIPGYSVQGVVTEAADGFFVVGEEMSAVQVNCEAGVLPALPQVGDVVRVSYNGMMTRSIPAQITAEAVEVLGPVETEE